jgi:hypothetical protein
MAPSISLSGTATGKGILIGMLSAFGSAGVIAIVLLLIWFFQYTQRGRIFLDRLGRPGEYDDEQAFLREEAEALDEMDDMQRMEYLRAKGACFAYSRLVCFLTYGDLVVQRTCIY